MIWIRFVAWPWLKRNWKWVLFPVGILALLFGTGVAAATIKEYAEPPDDLDEKMRETLKRLRKSELEHDKKVYELEQKHKEHLRQLTDAQQKELEELQGKPLEEVVTWFDRL